jgi:exosortase/archaeosortase family protein
MEKGFKQFLWKTGIFVMVFLIIQLLTMKITSQTLLPDSITPIYLVDLAKVGLFVLILFFVAYREKLSKLKESAFEIKSLIIFGALEIISLIGYFKFKVFILNNLSFVNAHLHLFQFLIYFILFLTLILLAFSIFGVKFIKNFIKKFKKELLISLGSFIILYILSYYVQQSWHYFSYIIANSVTWLLNLSSPTILSFQGYLPIIDFNSFKVAIDSPCSGIESMFLFTMLYLFITCLDWKVLNKKKLAVMFIPGLISVFALNILRIYLLIIIGADVSRDFALGMFHTNASWILFLAYFGLFWGLSYKWMKKNFKSKHLPKLK